MNQNISFSALLDYQGVDPESLAAILLQYQQKPYKQFSLSFAPPPPISPKSSIQMLSSSRKANVFDEWVLKQSHKKTIESIRSPQNKGAFAASIALKTSIQIGRSDYQTQNSNNIKSVTHNRLKSNSQLIKNSPVQKKMDSIANDRTKIDLNKQQTPKSSAFSKKLPKLMKTSYSNFKKQPSPLKGVLNKQKQQLQNSQANNQYGIMSAREIKYQNQIQIQKKLKEKSKNLQQNNQHQNIDYIFCKDSQKNKSKCNLSKASQLIEAYRGEMSLNDQFFDSDEGYSGTNQIHTFRSNQEPSFSGIGKNNDGQQTSSLVNYQDDHVWFSFANQPHNDNSPKKEQLMLQNLTDAEKLNHIDFANNMIHKICDLSQQSISIKGIESIESEYAAECSLEQRLAQNEINSQNMIQFPSNQQAKLYYSNNSSTRQHYQSSKENVNPFNQPKTMVSSKTYPQIAKTNSQPIILNVEQQKIRERSPANRFHQAKCKVNLIKFIPGSSKCIRISLKNSLVTNQ